MNESVDEIKRLLDQCSPEEKAELKRFLQSLLPHPLEAEWRTDSETILSAIRRSNDITKRGVRGIIAEAVFESSVVPRLAAEGWNPEIIIGDLSYDVHLTNGSASVRIQIKLQRLVKGEPFLYYPKHYEKNTLYVVEVQKTRTGKKKESQKKGKGGDEEVAIERGEQDTRPYRFSDFDILAVNMHPSSGDWKDFRYTVASWLVPRTNKNSLIEIMQPVAAKPNQLWTDNLEECLSWFLSGEKRQVMSELLHRKPKEKAQPKPKKRRKRSGKKRG